MRQCRAIRLLLLPLRTNSITRSILIVLALPTRRRNPWASPRRYRKDICRTSMIRSSVISRERGVSISIISFPNWEYQSTADGTKTETGYGNPLYADLLLMRLPKPAREKSCLNGLNEKSCNSHERLFGLRVHPWINRVLRMLDWYMTTEGREKSIIVP